MLFANDVMKISFKSFDLSIDAGDAFYSYCAQHTIENLEKFLLQKLQVPQALKWNKKLLNDGFTSSTNISLNEKKNDEKNEKNNNEKNSDLSSQSSKKQLIQKKYFDWTFSTDYCCTLNFLFENNNNIKKIKKIISAKELSEELSKKNKKLFSLEKKIEKIENKKNDDEHIKNENFLEWMEEEETSGIDFEMLKKTDQPILFYDEFILYQVFCFVFFSFL
jgi:hypothetical protein